MKIVPYQNIAQRWKLSSYITIKILKISFRNCVSSLLSTHYKTFPLKANLIWPKPRAFNPALKSIETPKFYRGEAYYNQKLSNYVGNK